MINRTGDVFTTEAVYIGHGVNCKGVMGKGIAKTIKERFPLAYSEYEELCSTNQPFLSHAQIVNCGDVSIVNMATQEHPGPDARYDALFVACAEGALKIVAECEESGRQPIMAIPQIGCGIGGLEWGKVETLLRAVEIVVPGFQFEVWVQ